MSKFMRPATPAAASQPAMGLPSRSTTGTAAEMEALGHPRKQAQTSKLIRTESIGVLPNPDGITEEASDRPTIASQKNSIEPPSLSDINKKMRKDSGAYNFIPLSTGKYMNDVWWEPTACTVSESKRVNGVPWLLLTVRIFIDTAGQTADIFSREMENHFRCDYGEVLRVCYLRSCIVNSYIRKLPPSYDDWYRDMVGVCNLSECESDAHFAQKVYEYTFSATDKVLPTGPTGLHVFFCKKPHQVIKDLETIPLCPNPNSMLCKAQGAKEFLYEFRVRFFYISYEKGEKREIPDDTM